MQKDLITLLEQSAADGWSVTDERRNGWQFYFIRHKLDQNRVVDTEHITVTVYVQTEGGRFLGSASEEIAPTASTEEMQKAISDLIERAAFVRNPAYLLRSPAKKEDGTEQEDHAESDAALNDGSSSSAQPHRAMPQDNPSLPQGRPKARVIREMDRTGENTWNLMGISMDFINMMNELPETATEDINSYEIFVNQIQRRLVTSTGIDQSQRYPSSMLEVVVNARNEAFLQTHKVENGAEEIELYRMYHSGTCDRQALQKDIARTLSYGKDRLRCQPTPELGRIPVVFSTADAVQIYRYFVERMNAQLVYQKISDWQMGKPIAEAKEVKGDRVTILAKRQLPNSSQNFLFDAEGAPIRDTVLIEDNEARHYWGSAMFSSYLGLQDTFILSNFAVEGGRKREEEIRAGRYLEVVEFSDFQVDAVTGAVYGEIRLGYLHDDDGSLTCVTGGSVSGSMRDYMKNMYFSRETVQYDNAQIPAVTKLMNVTVTGAGR